MLIHDKVICDWEVNPYSDVFPDEGIHEMTNDELLEEYVRLDSIDLDYETEVYADYRQRYIRKEAKKRGYDIQQDIQIVENEESIRRLLEVEE